MASLTDTDLTRLEHAKDKLKALRKLGYREEAEELLWELITEERRFTLDEASLKRFTEGLDDRDGAQCLALFRTLVEDGVSDFSNHYGYTHYYKYDRYISIHLRHLVKEHPEVLREHHLSLAAPYDALAAIALAAAEELDGFAPTLLPGVARWLLDVEDRWYLRYLVHELPASRIPALVDEARWHEVCLELGIAHTVNWDVFPNAALADTSDEELIQLAIFQGAVCDPALTQEVKARGKRLLPLLEAAFVSPAASDAAGPPIAPGALLGWIELLSKQRQPLPPGCLSSLEDLLRSYDTNEQKTNVLMHALAKIPSADAKAMVLRHTPGHSSAARVFSAVQDDTIFADVIDALITSDANDGESWSQDDYIKGFAAAGMRVLPTLEVMLARDCPVKIATMLTQSLVMMGAPTESLPLLGSLLGHRSKRVREAAAEGLALRGDDAMHVLEEGLLASTKKHREAALAALHQTQPSEARDALLDAVAATSKHKAIVEALARLPRHQHPNDDAQGEDALSQLHQLKQLLDQGPTTSTPPALRELLEASPFDLEEWADEFAPHRDEPLAPWIAVAQVAREEWLSYIQSEQAVMSAVERLATHLGDALVAPLCQLSLYEYGQEVLFPLLAKLDPAKALPVLLEGIEQSRGKGLYAQIKPLRRAAVDALPLVGAIAIPPLVELLAARKKDLRQAAAEVLFRLASSPGEGADTEHIDDAITALEAAFAKEKVDAVKTTIGKALTAFKATQEQTAAPEALGDHELDAYLASLPLVPLPDVLDLRQLPPLQLVGGHELSHDAVWGWLSLLSHHSPQQPNATAMALRDRFARVSLCDFGARLLDEWSNHGSNNQHRWMQFQRSITASTSWLLEHGEWLDERELEFYVHHGSRLGLLCAWHQLHNDDHGTYRNHPLLGSVRQASQLSQAMKAAFAAEREDRLIDDYALSPEGRGVEHIEGNISLPIRLYPMESPSLGVPLPALALRINAELFDENAYTEEQLRQARQLCQKLEGKIRRTTQQIHARLDDAATSPRAWSQAGWSALFTRHPLWSMLGQGLLFCDDQGRRFIRSPAGDAIGADGVPVALEDDAMIYVQLLNAEGQLIGGRSEVDGAKGGTEPLTIAPTESKQWQTLLDRWYGQDESALAPAPADPLFAIRDLLYAPPSEDGWEALRAVLESWPQDGSLDVALSYIDAHIGAWGDLDRPAPLRWSAHLLDPKNERRQQLLDHDEDADYPLLQACNHLIFEGADLKYSDAFNIATSDALQNIQHLDIRWGRIYKGADTELARRASFPALQRLSLHYVTIRKLGWKELFGAPWVHKCKHISLRHMQIDWSRLEAIIEAGALDQVEVLDLRDNSLGIPGVEVLCKAAPFPRLKDLRLNIYDLGAPGYRQLCQSDGFQALESLTMIIPSYWYLEEFSSEPLAQSPHFPNLKKLVLVNNDASSYGISDEWTKALIESTQLPEAARQYVESNYVSRSSS